MVSHGNDHGDYHGEKYVDSVHLRYEWLNSLNSMVCDRYNDLINGSINQLRLGTPIP